MRNQQAKGTQKTGSLQKEAANIRGLFDEQPAAYRKVQNEEAETYTKLRNVTDILRQTGVKF